MNTFEKYPEIILAVMSGDIGRVRDAINSGEDVNAKSPDRGRTPLHYAAYLKLADIEKLLIENGACKECPDKAEIKPADFYEEPERQMEVYAGYERGVLVKASASAVAHSPTCRKRL